MNKTDPWEHRAKGMRCDTCMWFVLKGDGPIGRCRRHAPTMNGYPVVYQKDWCGDHKLDETVLTVFASLAPMETRGETNG